MKKALILNASYCEIEAILALHKHGYYVIATGRDRGAAGEKFVDKYIQADYSDKERILQIAREQKIDVIVPNINDYGVRTAAYVAEKLGLPGHDSYCTAVLLSDKDKFKQFALENGIATPNAVPFTSYDEALSYIYSEQGSPLIVKPSDACGGLGISKIETIEQARPALDAAFQSSRNGHIIIEPFIEGTLHGFTSFLKDKKVICYGTDSEFMFVNKYRVEMGLYPSNVEEQVKDVMIRQVEKMADLLDLKDGIFHLQFIMSKDGPQIIEVMRRNLGNMCLLCSKMRLGMDWVYWEVRARCGLNISSLTHNIEPSGFYAFKNIVGTKDGVIRKIEIPEKLSKRTFYRLDFLSEGQLLENCAKKSVGTLFMEFRTQEEMYQTLVDGFDGDLVKY